MNSQSSWESARKTERLRKMHGKPMGTAQQKGTHDWKHNGKSENNASTIRFFQWMDDSNFVSVPS